MKQKLLCGSKIDDSRDSLQKKLHKKYVVLIE